MTSSTSLIIPRTKSPQGWIASAKTYRLILDDEALWAICIGRAMGMRVKSRDPIADFLAGKMINKMEARMEKQLAAAEDEIENVPPSELVKRKPLSPGSTQRKRRRHLRSTQPPRPPPHHQVRWQKTQTRRPL